MRRCGSGCRQGRIDLGFVGLIEERLRTHSFLHSQPLAPRVSGKNHEKRVLSCFYEGSSAADKKNPPLSFLICSLCLRKIGVPLIHPPNMCCTAEAPAKVLAYGVCVYACTYIYMPTEPPMIHKALVPKATLSVRLSPTNQSH